MVLSAEKEREQLLAAARELAKQGKDTSGVMWARDQIAKQAEPADEEPPLES